MAEQKIGIVITGNAATAMEQTATAATKTATQVKSAKQELRELTKQMADMDVNSKEFATAATRAGQLKDQLNDAADAVKGSTGPAFESMNNTFSVMTGQIQNLDFDGLGQSLTSMGRAVGRINLKTIKDELGGLAKGFANLAKSLLTNPYLLLAAAIAAIVMNFDTIIKQFPAIEKGLTGINEIERDTLKIQQEKAKASKHEYDQLSNMDNLLKARGFSEKQILEYKAKALRASIEDAKVVLQTQKNQATSQLLAAQRNREILEGMIRWINAPLYLLLSTVDKIAGWVGQQTNLAEGLVNLAADLVVDPQEKADELTASFQEQTDALVAMENQYQGFIQGIQEIDKKTAEQRKQLAKEQAQERERLQKEADEKEVERRRKLKEAEEEEIKNESLKLKRIDEVRAENYDAQLLKRMEAQSRLREIEERFQKDSLENAKWTAEQEAKIRDEKVAMSIQALTVIDDFTQLFAKKGEVSAKRAFQLHKAASIAQAVIETYKGANAIFTAAALNPASVLFPAQPFINAGIAIASGLANVAKISQQQFTGGSTGGGGGVSSPSMGGGGTSNQPNPLSFAFLGNRQQQQPPIQAYVVSGQVNTSIEAQTLIRNQAKLH